MARECMPGVKEAGSKKDHHWQGKEINTQEHLTPIWLRYEKWEGCNCQQNIVHIMVTFAQATNCTQKCKPPYGSCHNDPYGSDKVMLRATLYHPIRYICCNSAANVTKATQYQVEVSS